MVVIELYSNWARVQVVNRTFLIICMEFKLVFQMFDLIPNLKAIGFGSHFDDGTLSQIMYQLTSTKQRRKDEICSVTLIFHPMRFHANHACMY